MAQTESIPDAQTAAPTLDRSALIARLTRRGRVAEHDVAALRRMIEQSGSVTRAEAEALFAVERAVVDKVDAWTGFLIETITDHVVWQARPTGVLSGAQAEWLLEAADRCDALTAIGVLANVLAESHRAPSWFVAAVRGRAARTLGTNWADAQPADATSTATLAPVARAV